MDEQKTYEPIKIEIEVGSRVNALTIADGIINYLGTWRRENPYIMSETQELDMYEGIRMIGEALLSVYKTYERHKQFEERRYR